MATVVVPDTPVTSSHFEVEVAAALISAIRVELSDSTEVKLELTVLSRSDASEKVVSASETCTVNETVAAVPSSARRRVLDDDAEEEQQEEEEAAGPIVVDFRQMKGQKRDRDHGE